MDDSHKPSVVRRIGSSSPCIRTSETKRVAGEMNIRFLVRIFVAAIVALGAICGAAAARPTASTAIRHTPPSSVAIGPQYDTTHVYVAPEAFDRLVHSLISTFGGSKSKQGVFQVTPTPSQTMSQLVLTPVGSISVFGFKTPVPYPFGAERTGYLVRDLDVATLAAKSAGAAVLVAPFPDPIGRDVVVQWPGGINMQLYWHTVAPDYARLATVPENRIYLSADAANQFIAAWARFSHGKVISDERTADGKDIGMPGERFRRVRLLSGFGKLTVLVTDGHLSWPFGRELTGYEVSDLAATLARATSAGATVLVAPYTADGREAAIVQFPGGYIAEIHSVRVSP
jgi:predicted enzyme related to lactoylglutathione lyase